MQKVNASQAPCHAWKLHGLQGGRYLNSSRLCFLFLTSNIIQSCFGNIHGCYPFRRHRPTGVHTAAFNEQLGT